MAKHEPILYNGELHNFPDDFTENDIAKALLQEDITANPPNPKMPIPHGLQGVSKTPREHNDSLSGHGETPKPAGPMDKALLTGGAIAGSLGGPASLIGKMLLGGTSGGTNSVLQDVVDNKNISLSKAGVEGALGALGSTLPGVAGKAISTSKTISGERKALEELTKQLVEAKKAEATAAKAVTQATRKELHPATLKRLTEISEDAKAARKDIANNIAEAKTKQTNLPSILKGTVPAAAEGIAIWELLKMLKGGQ